jgi:hypothetical protein
LRLAEIEEAYNVLCMIRNGEGEAITRSTFDDLGTLDLAHVAWKALIGNPGLEDFT